MAKKDTEFANGAETPNTDAVDANIETNSKAGPVTAQAKDINSLNPAPGPDTGEAEVQARVDAEQAAGFRGIETDPTPNENYTVAGNDLPTPETDESLRAEAVAARRIDGPSPA